MTLSILLVDDDDVARESIIRGLKRNRIAIPVVEAEDGFIALQIMQGTHPDRSIQKPFIVLLDLNMPGMDGLEFLDVVRSGPVIADTAIYVLSTSSADVDIKSASSKDVAGYFVKSTAGFDFDVLSRVLEGEPARGLMAPT